MSLQGLEHGALDLVLLLAQELLGGGLQQVGVLHNLDLRHPGHGQRDALSRLNRLAHRVQGHHLQGKRDFLLFLLDHDARKQRELLK